MNTATRPAVTTIKLPSGNLVRTWQDDNELNVQLTTATQVELSRSRLTGEGKHILAAALVAALKANA